MTPAPCPCGDILRPGAAVCWVCGQAASAPGPTCIVCRVRLVPQARGRWPQYCANHRRERQREYQREYQRRPEVAERQREYHREYRQRPEARRPDADPIRETLIRITEEMPAFSDPHQQARAALAADPAQARRTLEAILGSLHPASPPRGLIENTRS